MTTVTASLLALHVPDKTTGVHRLPDGGLTYACTECGMDWPCDVVALSKAARAVLDYDEKERWGGPHDWLSGLIGYYATPEPVAEPPDIPGTATLLGITEEDVTNLMEAGVLVPLATPEPVEGEPT